MLIPLLALIYIVLVYLLLTIAQKLRKVNGNG